LKNTRIIITVCLILVAIIGITVVLNRENAAEMGSLNANATFKIISDGSEVKSFNMEEIMALGMHDFTANLKTSGNDPILYTYSGVLLKDVFTAAGVSLEDRKAVIVTAADGYTVAVPLEKVLEDDNVFLAIKREGAYIGSREEGGKGPYQMIISKDQFSQYWCKYALSAEAK